MKFTALALATAASATIVNRKCQTPEVVQDFDLEAYLGTWYEVIRDKGTWYEHGICVTADYSLADDGTVSIQNDIYHDDRQKWAGITIPGVVLADPSKDEGDLDVGGIDY